MDAKAAMDKISSLENELRYLRQDVQNLTAVIDNYKAFVDSVPDCFPDGEKTLSAFLWLQWAKKQLGYVE